MAVKKSIRKAGRPEAAGMSTESIVNKIEHEITKANRNAANNLGKYFSILNDYAMGKGSDTNTVSSCKFFIEMAQEYLEEQGMEEASESENQEETTVETKQVSNGEPALSFAEKKALWDAKKADK